MSLALHGSFVALVTPFTNDNEVDYKAICNLIDRQINAGISGIVPCGTTGESSSLNSSEYLRVVETVVKQVNGRIPVVAGAGGNNTAKTIELAGQVKACGADALLSVCPCTSMRQSAGFREMTPATCLSKAWLSGSSSAEPCRK